MGDNRRRGRDLALQVSIAGLILAAIGIAITLVLSGDFRNWVTNQIWPGASAFLHWLWQLFWALGDWRLQLAVVAICLAQLLAGCLFAALWWGQQANAAVRRAEADRDERVAAALARTNEATTEAEGVVSNASKQLDSLRREADNRARELDRLENLRRAMIALDEATISEMVVAGADPSTKRAEAVSWILYAVQRVLGMELRPSFVECIRDGRARAIPFPRSSDPQIHGASRYSLRVLKNYGLTELEINDVASLTEDVGLANRAISSGKFAYVPDVTADNAESLGYWRPPHKVPYLSMICVPAFAKNRVVGVLCVDSPRAEAFGDWEKDVLVHFALKIALRYASLPTEGLWD